MLADKGIEFERRDYFKEPFSVDELQALFAETGLKPSDVLSTRGKAYRDLDLANRDLSEEELMELVPDNPTLLRRPLLVENGQVVVGFDEEKIESLIKQARDSEGSG